MSGHGISPTWFGNTKFGVPLIFGIQSLHVIFLTCDIAFLGDVSNDKTLSLACTIDDGTIKAFLDLVLTCTTTSAGDVTKTINHSLACAVVVNDA